MFEIFLLLLKVFINMNSSEKNIKKIRKEIDTNPSEKQTECGNYKKGHVSINGFRITIENPKNSIS